MLVLGLGLGMVMQVLVLAAQNAVAYEYLGVATSGSTLFRSIGGSFGVVGLRRDLREPPRRESRSRLPAGAYDSEGVEPGGDQAPPRRPCTTPYDNGRRPRPCIRSSYLGAAIALVAFALTWLLREIPLRATARVPDTRRGLGAASEDDSLGEVSRDLAEQPGERERDECDRRAEVEDRMQGLGHGGCVRVVHGRGEVLDHLPVRRRNRRACRKAPRDSRRAGSRRSREDRDPDRASDRAEQTSSRRSRRQGTRREPRSGPEHEHLHDHAEPEAEHEHVQPRLQAGGVSPRAARAAASRISHNQRCEERLVAAVPRLMSWPLTIEVIRTPAINGVMRSPETVGLSPRSG